MLSDLASNWGVLLVASLVTLAVAIAGGLLTEIGIWYNSLRFPPWKPPNWAFGPIWTTIFVLAVLSATLAWAGASSSQRFWLVALFLANAFFNILWNVLFFKWRRPDWALIETGFLWASILALILFIRPISQPAALMLAPYLAWVTIAWALNLSIVRRNAPFAGVPARSL
jgi:tryptophan-rich sensory protein